MSKLNPNDFPETDKLAIKLDDLFEALKHGIEELCNSISKETGAYIEKKLKDKNNA